MRKPVAAFKREQFDIVICDDGSSWERDSTKWFADWAESDAAIPGTLRAIQRANAAKDRAKVPVEVFDT